ncbi:CD70 antigen [Otolemur garnettii]|uniref:CD70 antigen n=1 Tax=Otolemur garnettii TaxID=30611 RepID=H0WI02_OTOGA|nr:CD70 antigen [Otolemur garnettii]
MAEDGSGCQVPRLVWRCVPNALPLLCLAMGIYCLLCNLVLCPQQQQLRSPGWDIAELQLNYTGPRQDPRLHWQAGPELGRSFLHGLELDNGQLRICRDGIYRLHIQVTLANCSFRRTTTPRSASLVVGICAPTTHTISLLRLSFHQGCTVASQRLVPLAQGDILCTNLTLPLLPSQNADETFFGIQWVHT